jgi:hypothetical protein
MMGRHAKRALFTSVLNRCCTAPVTWSVASVPCQHSGRTFLDCKAGTRPEQCGIQVQTQSCTLGNFVVNLGNFLYLLYLLGTYWYVLGKTGKQMHMMLGIELCISCTASCTLYHYASSMHSMVILMIKKGIALTLHGTYWLVSYVWHGSSSAPQLLP